MTNASPVIDVLHMLHRDRATWRFRAELDPSALCEIIGVMAQELKVSRDVALRIIESELEVRPLPSRGASPQGITRQELPCAAEATPGATSSDRPEASRGSARPRGEGHGSRRMGRPWEGRSLTMSPAQPAGGEGSGVSAVVSAVRRSARCIRAVHSGSSK